MTVFVLPAEALAWMSGRLEAWGGVKEDLDAETFLDDAYIGTVGRRWSGDVDEAVRSFFRGQHEILGWAGWKSSMASRTCRGA